MTIVIVIVDIVFVLVNACIFSFGILCAITTLQQHNRTSIVLIVDYLWVVSKECILGEFAEE
jgi:hypothetical protein